MLHNFVYTAITLPLVLTAAAAATAATTITTTTTCTIAHSARYAGALIRLLVEFTTLHESMTLHLALGRIGLKYAMPCHFTQLAGAHTLDRRVDDLTRGVGASEREQALL